MTQSENLLLSLIENKRSIPYSFLVLSEKKQIPHAFQF